MNRHLLIGALCIAITGCGNDDEQIQPVVIFNEISDWASTIAIDPLMNGDNSRLVATAGNSNAAIRLWDVTTGEEKLKLQGQEAAVQDLAFSPQGRFLASASRDKTVRLWDCFGDSWCLTLREHDSAVNSVAFSPDGKQLASGSSDRTIVIRSIVVKEQTNVYAGEELLTLTGHRSEVTSVAFSPDGKRCLLYTSDAADE